MVVIFGILCILAALAGIGDAVSRSSARRNRSLESRQLDQIQTTVDLILLNDIMD